jgi:hypothetical protein
MKKEECKENVSEAQGTPAGPVLMMAFVGGFFGSALGVVIVHFLTRTVSGQ